VQKGYQVTKWMKGHATSLYNHQDAILQALKPKTNLGAQSGAWNHQGTITSNSQDPVL
jgi:hypothetical protein